MFEILAGYLLDLIVGDPGWRFHPVRLIGTAIGKGEEALRKVVKGPVGERIGGVMLTVTVTGVSYLIPYQLLKLAGSYRPVCYLINVLLIYFILAARSLDKEATRVYKALVEGDIHLARDMLSRIVGRDTRNLNRQEIVRAAVETVAENTSDGVIAPLFYLFTGGVPLGMAYKAVNTLDSMVGYKNERYLNFGWASARLDDIVNYIPARISGIMLVAASALCYKTCYLSWKILRRDGGKHPSPNSGYPEAAVAGALGIQLGGASSYSGKKVEKPIIGDPLREGEAADINRAVRLMHVASFIALFIFFLIKGLITYISV